MIRPPFFFLHAGESRLGKEEGADDEEVEHAAIEVFVVLLDGKLGLGRSGIGDDDVDGPKFVPGLLNEAADFRFLGDIGPNGDGFSSLGDDFTGDFFSPGDIVEGVDDDFCSCVCECSDDACAEAFAASGDEGDMAIQ